MVINVQDYKDIHQRYRLVQELNFTGSESIIRLKVKELRNEIKKVFIPLQFNPSEAMPLFVHTMPLTENFVM